MDRNNLLDVLTTEDVIKIVESLGGGRPTLPDNQGNIYFKTICHGGDKHKLQFFVKTKMFCCYTNCGSMSLFDLIMNVKCCNFIESIDYVCKFKGIKNNFSKGRGLKQNDSNEEDLDFLNIHLFKTNKTEAKLPVYNPLVLHIFDEYIPTTWVDEGINEEVAKIFGIGFYFNQYKATIPHKDIEGELVGIRGRAFLKRDVDKGQKYMPLTIQGLTYRFPSGYNLYGIYENKENIKRLKKAIIFEGEKSVLKYGSYFQQQNNIALATMGMNFTTYQRDILLNLGVEEIIIAYDKQYLIEHIDSEDKTTKEYKEYEKYIKNLIKITKLLINYVKVSIIACWTDELQYKDAPIDGGKDIFIKLFNERYLVEDVEELKELIE